jgi:hypothetical protein
MEKKTGSEAWDELKINDFILMLAKLCIKIISLVASMLFFFECSLLATSPYIYIGDAPQAYGGVCNKNAFFAVPHATQPTSGGRKQKKPQPHHIPTRGRGKGDKKKRLHNKFLI